MFLCCFEMIWYAEQRVRDGECMFGVEVEKKEFVLVVVFYVFFVDVIFLQVVVFFYVGVEVVEQQKFVF